MRVLVAGMLVQGCRFVDSIGQHIVTTCRGIAVQFVVPIAIVCVNLQPPNPAHLPFRSARQLFGLRVL